MADPRISKEMIEAGAEAIRVEWAANRSDPGDEAMARAVLEAAFALLPEPDSKPDTWCREESCRYRHWRSGSMPTHQRGADCPVPDTNEGEKR